MATAPQVHSTISKHDWMLNRSAPRIEAQALFVAMRQRGETPESVRELIEVPEDARRHLTAFTQSYPEEAPLIELALRFRRLVAEEFERLARSCGVEQGMQ